MAPELLITVLPADVWCVSLLTVPIVPIPVVDKLPVPNIKVELAPELVITVLPPDVW